MLITLYSKVPTAWRAEAAQPFLRKENAEESGSEIWMSHNGDPLINLETTTVEDALLAVNEKLKAEPVDSLLLSHFHNAVEIKASEDISTSRKTLVLWIGCDVLQKEDFKNYGPGRYYFFSLVDSSETKLLELLSKHSKHLIEGHEAPLGNDFVAVYNDIEKELKRLNLPRYFFANWFNEAPKESLKFGCIECIRTVVMY